MKNNKIMLLLAAMLCSVFTISAGNEKKYSVEFNTNVGFNSFTSLDGVDALLHESGYPTFTDNLNVSVGGSTNLIFRINKLGILAGFNSYGLYTTADAMGKYYGGTGDVTTLGVSYDVVSSKWFTLTPYLSAGVQSMEMYLDYKFEEGVSPTSLAIKASETAVNIGALLYFRVGSWYEERLQLFVNAELLYNMSQVGEWRFDNMLMDSSEFNLSHLNTGVGLSLRYYFK